MTRAEIMECADIEKLKALCLEYRKQASVISEILVDESKWHISSHDAINKIREYLVRNQHEFDFIMRKGEEDE